MRPEQAGRLRSQLLELAVTDAQAGRLCSPAFRRQRSPVRGFDGRDAVPAHQAFAAPQAARSRAPIGLPGGKSAGA